MRAGEPPTRVRIITLTIRMYMQVRLDELQKIENLQAVMSLEKKRLKDKGDEICNRYLPLCNDFGTEHASDIMSVDPDMELWHAAEHRLLDDVCVLVKRKRVFGSYLTRLSSSYYNVDQ